MLAMRWSRSAQRSSSTRIIDVSTGMRSKVASRITPVSPMPPVVAQKISGVSVGVTVSTSPLPVSRVSECTWLPNVPSTWWPLPWMSDAIAPPTVT